MIASLRLAGLAVALVSLTGASAPPAETPPALVLASLAIDLPPTPADYAPEPAALPLITPPPPAVDSAEHACLADAVYHEARGEPRAGQIAVAQVVVNRARSGRFAPTLCKVVAQPGQFPFKRKPEAARNAAQWARAQAVARAVMLGEAESVAARALYFHATHVSPGWKRAQVAAVGNHIFYR